MKSLLEVFHKSTKNDWKPLKLYTFFLLFLFSFLNAIWGWKNLDSKKLKKIKKLKRDCAWKGLIEIKNLFRLRKEIDNSATKQIKINNQTIT